MEAQVAGLASAEKFARAAEEEIRFGDFETVGSADHGFEARARFVRQTEGGDEDAMGFLRAAADASAKLVELGEAETLGVLDDHDGGVRDVDADFDDGGGDEDLRFVLAEALHDFFFFVAGEAAVEKAELELGKNFAREALVFVDGGFELELRFLDDGIDDVGLMSGGNFAAERFPNAGEMLLGGHARGDGSAAGRKLVENGNVEVAIESERESTRNGRGSEDEDVRGVAVGGGFVHQALALEDAEAVLLVNGDEAEAGGREGRFLEGRGGDDGV